MSLLEDVFLQDEADEAQELERIIEGDEDERPRSRQDSDENSEKEDEAEEDKRRVDPTKAKAKREVKNPRFILNPARLMGPRGIQVIPEHFKNFQFKGKGQEKEDLDLVLKKLEHWAYRLYPRFQFEDCLKKIESLGKKRPVMVHLHKIRSDQLLSEETVVQQDSSDEETAAPQQEDEFDKLLQQQIELARATAAADESAVMHTPVNTPAQKPVGSVNRSSHNLPMAPKATSSPSINDEQRERMLLNRKLAEERRLAKLRANNPGDPNRILENRDETQVSESKNEGEVSGRDVDFLFDAVKETANNNKSDDKMKIDDVIEAPDGLRVLGKEVKAKKNRSHVIDSSDSSDSDDGEATVNQSVIVDVHRVATQNGNANVEDILDSEIPTVDLVGTDFGTMNGMRRENASNNDDADSVVVDVHRVVSQNGNANVEDILDSEIPTVDLVGTEFGTMNGMRRENVSNNALDTDDIITVDEMNHGVTQGNVSAHTIDLVDDGAHNKKQSNSNVIDSSDEECAFVTEASIMKTGDKNCNGDIIMIEQNNSRDDEKDENPKNDSEKAAKEELENVKEIIMDIDLSDDF